MIELYETQRAMRNMRKIAMQRGVIAVLDVGTSKIACLVLRFDGTGTEDDSIGSLAGQSGFRVIGAATTRSRGVRFGEISAMGETERAIRTAVHAAQKMAGIKVDHVIAALSGGGARSYGLAGAVDVAATVVDEQDVARVLSACDVPDFGHGREVLHAQPVNFALDHRSGLMDPRGQIGNELSCDMHMLTVDAQALQNLVQCIKRCDLEVAGLASTAYVSGISALAEKIIDDSKELPRKPRAAPRACFRAVTASTPCVTSCSCRRFAQNTYSSREDATNSSVRSAAEASSCRCAMSGCSTHAPSDSST